MAAEAGGEIPGWTQMVGAVTLFACTVFGVVYRYIKSYREDEKPEARTMVLEQAELADLRPIRDLGKKLEQIYRVVEDNHEILTLLREMKADHDLEMRLRKEREMDELREIARSRDKRSRPHGDT